MYQAPRGTSDILPDQQNNWNFVKDIAKKSSETFGFKEIATPTFEETELFKRGVGSDSDIVQKEMYSFTDSSEKSFTLKPEGTAATCRSFIENGMNNLSKPVRLFYISSMYRHERPQSGRLRQHHQFGAEIFGDESPEIDSELIELALHYLNSLGLKNLKIKINSIGDVTTRSKFSEDLKLFFGPYKSQMNSVDKKRLETNPIRLLDSKDEKLLTLKENSPKSIDYLDEESETHWNSVLNNIQKLTKTYNEFDIEIDHKLVRGLDYYNRTVFEIHPNEEKSQSSILSGGRYDGLMSLLGGPDVPGVGFGSGIERIILNLKNQKILLPDSYDNKGPELMIISVGDQHITDTSIEIATFLRKNNISVILAPKNRSIKGQMRYANSCDSKNVLIIGKNELEKKSASIKNLNDSSEKTVELSSKNILKILKEK